MIRKVIIVVLTLGAVGTMLAAVASYQFPSGGAYYDANRRVAYFGHIARGSLDLVKVNQLASFSIKPSGNLVTWTMGDRRYSVYCNTAPVCEQTGWGQMPFVQVPFGLWAACLVHTSSGSFHLQFAGSLAVRSTADVE